MVEAAAVAPEAAENTPEEAAVLEEAATATNQCQLLFSSSEYFFLWKFDSENQCNCLFLVQYV
jgi:hypothetical protein